MSATHRTPLYVRYRASGGVRRETSPLDSFLPGLTVQLIVLAILLPIFDLNQLVQ
ncbi:MAG TPA: hypothetical protein VGE57_07260 [Solimonas sp.]